MNIHKNQGLIQVTRCTCDDQPEQEFSHEFGVSTFAEECDFCSMMRQLRDREYISIEAQESAEEVLMSAMEVA